MTATPPRSLSGIEGRLPPEIASQAETDGVAKAGQQVIVLLTLGVLGGAFVALGAVFANVALTGTEGVVPFGLARVIAGVAFSLGLCLVLLGGAQIFTGDVLMVMAWASGRLAFRRILRAWFIVYFGNLVGAIGTAMLVFLAQHHAFGGGAVGLTALRTAEAKAGLPFVQALLLGILCNALVCMAIWLSLSSRQAAHRLILIILPVAAFVAAGFEHSVANMYFLSFGLMIRGGATSSFWQTVGLDPARQGGFKLSAGGGVGQGRKAPRGLPLVSVPLRAPSQSDFQRHFQRDGEASATRQAAAPPTESVRRRGRLKSDECWSSETSAPTCSSATGAERASSGKLEPLWNFF